jgi:hypothetical protein
MASLAVGSHWLWNTGIELIDSNDFFIYAIIPPVAFVILGFCLRSQEREELMYWGQKSVESGAVSLEELALVYDLDLRKRTRRMMTSSVEKRQFDEKISSDVHRILGSTNSELP